MLLLFWFDKLTSFCLPCQFLYVCCRLAQAYYPQVAEVMAELEGACDWSDDEDTSHDNDAWKDAFDREVTRRPHRGVARDCLVP